MNRIAIYCCLMAVMLGVPHAATACHSDIGGFSWEKRPDRLLISLDGQPIVEFVFQDEQIHRPYFANARIVQGLQLTRNHPPVPGKDASDHEAMHPGIWLAFGDINGFDYWRNQAPMEHLGFVVEPMLQDGQLHFVTECRLRTSTGDPLCLLTNNIVLSARPTGWLLKWDATFQADTCDIVFGDQEEMGFGVRVATPWIEKNGGRILNSAGAQTAKGTWGQSAKWCEYSGSSQCDPGILVMAGENFRESWWHNRDYGLMVANPFGREAMKQGSKSAVKVAKGESLHLRFGALVFGGPSAERPRPDAEREYQFFLKIR
ncbi:MAG: DUF6807 family protein [Pirellula sp.]